MIKGSVANTKAHYTQAFAVPTNPILKMLDIQYVVLYGTGAIIDNIRAYVASSTCTFSTLG